MAKVKDASKTRRCGPALSAESRENQLIALSMDAAEKQLREGTASSQVITHFLKLGSIKGQMELEKLKQETALLEAKKESIASEKTMSEMYTKALEAMRIYGGIDGSKED